VKVWRLNEQTIRKYTMYRKIDISDIRQWLEEFENRPPIIPNLSHPEELASLLGQLAVTDRFPDMRKGQFWCVYAQSHPGKTENSFDILVHMFATAFETASDCQGLRIALQDEDGIYWSTRSLVDHRGQVWFKNVKPGRYHGVPDHVQLYAGSQDTATDRLETESQKEDTMVFYPADRRIRVVLSSKPGRTTVTVSTEAEDLSDSSIRFAIGETRGALNLKAIGSPGVWEATCELKETFSDAVKRGAQFNVIRVDNTKSSSEKWPIDSKSTPDKQISKDKLVVHLSERKDNVAEQVARLLLPEDMGFAIRLTIDDAMRDSEEIQSPEQEVRSSGLRRAAFTSGEDENIQKTVLIVGRVLDFVDRLCDQLLQRCSSVEDIAKELEPSISESVDLLALEETSPLFTSLKALLADGFTHPADGNDAMT